MSIAAEKLPLPLPRRDVRKKTLPHRCATSTVYKLAAAVMGFQKNVSNFTVATVLQASKLAGLGQWLNEVFLLSRAH